VKKLKRVLLGLTMANFASCIYLSDYVSRHWLVVAYVMGSFGLLIAMMVIAE
jgi:hypothetical protein